VSAGPDLSERERTGERDALDGAERAMARHGSIGRTPEGSGRHETIGRAEDEARSPRDPFQQSNNAHVSRALGVR
jgi:hypothetical protein